MARRGLTFLEVVIAIAMLSVFATLALGSIGYLAVNAERNKHRLQATELAHRVIVQYLDDREKAPDPDQSIWQGDAQYRVEIIKSVLDLEQSAVEGLREGTVRDEADTDMQAQLVNMHKLTVLVFKWEPKSEADTFTPVVELSRLYYPFLNDQEWAQRWLLDMISNATDIPSTPREN